MSPWSWFLAVIQCVNGLLQSSEIFNTEGRATHRIIDAVRANCIKSTQVDGNCEKTTEKNRDFSFPFRSVPSLKWSKKIPQCSSLFMEFNFNHRVVYPLHSNKFPTLAVDLMIMKFPQDEDRRFLAWINCCNGHKQFTTEPFIATTMNFLGWDFFLASLALRLPFSTKLSRFNSWFCSSVGYESHSLKRIKSNELPSIEWWLVKCVPVEIWISINRSIEAYSKWKLVS